MLYKNIHFFLIADLPLQLPAAELGLVLVGRGRATALRRKCTGAGAVQRAPLQQLVGLGRTPQ